MQYNKIPYIWNWGKATDLLIVCGPNVPFFIQVHIGSIFKGLIIKILPGNDDFLQTIKCTMQCVSDYMLNTYRVTLACRGGAGIVDIPEAYRSLKL